CIHLACSFVTRRLPPTSPLFPYTTLFRSEFVGPEGTAQSTLSGGGRYDYLVEEIGGPPTPAIGFGAGIERLVLAIEGEGGAPPRSEEHTSELQSRGHLVCRLLLEKKKKNR